MFTVIYKDPYCSGLQTQDFETKKEVQKFLRDKDETVCPSGETVYYVVAEDAKSVEKGLIDRT